MLSRGLLVTALLLACFSPTTSMLVVDAVTTTKSRLRHNVRPTSIMASQPALRSSKTRLQASIVSPCLSTAFARLPDVSRLLLKIRGGGGAVGSVVDPALVDAACSWCSDLGAPAALVAGAVAATLYDQVQSAKPADAKDDSNGANSWMSTMLSLSPRKKRAILAFGKKLSKFLLLSAFALEVFSIFSSTITRTLLRSTDFTSMKTTATTPLGFLQMHYTFEYLTCRITFLQGLLNWLCAICLRTFIQGEEQDDGTVTTPSVRKVNQFLGYSLFTVITLIMAFYNGHLAMENSPYMNYWDMVQHWFVLTVDRYLYNWPPRPMAVITIPLTMLSLYKGYQAFFGDSDQGNDK